MQAYQTQLIESAASLGVSLSEAEAQQLLSYGALLQKWNKVYNLSSAVSDTEVLSLHLLDALSVVAPMRTWLAANPVAKVLDVGSGAGLPGVVLAIIFPEIKICCVDAVSKKTSFIQQAALSLGFKNLEAQHARVESLAAAQADLIISRAFASLSDFVNLTEKHLSPTGIWMAMKGKMPTVELTELPPHVEMFHVEQLHVPNLDAQRHLLYLRNK